MLAAALKKAQARVQARQLTERGYALRGNNLLAQTMTEPEMLLVGAAGTGKTLAILHKINAAMWQYPGARALIVRKVRADLAESVLVTFERDILGLDNPICAGIQRENRKIYRYPNGSEVVVGGMDRPGRILSTEYDLIYPAEAVQFDEQDWETFIMRNRNYVMPYQQVIGDTNPDVPHHWLKQRCDAGTCVLLNTYHQNNPAYWDGNDWTERGRDYVLGKLGRLTGVRKARYLEGKWVIAEGAVYETYNPAVHVIDPFDIPAEWRRFRSVDFGYTNPFSCSWWAMDHDGRLYQYRQIYFTKRTVRAHAEQIKRLTGNERIEFTVTDHDAEDRATLEECGISTVAAVKDISRGIQAVTERMVVAGDGKPRIFFLRGNLVERDETLAEAKQPVSTVDEIPSYVWPKGADGKSLKETPVDANNHGCDEMRYMVMAVDPANQLQPLREGRVEGLGTYRG